MKRSFITFLLFLWAAVFPASAQGWQLRQEITQPYPVNGNFFGFAMAKSQDIIAINARNELTDTVTYAPQLGKGAIYLAKKIGNDFSIYQKLVSPSANPSFDFGEYCGFSGKYLLAGCPANHTNASGGGFGGGTPVPEVGAVYIHETDTAGYYHLVQKLVHDDPMFKDWFGKSACMYGSYIFISAPGQDYDTLGNFLEDAGAIYVYRKNSVTHLWEYYKKITENVRSEFGYLGYGTGIAMIGDQLIVGSAGDSYDITGGGYLLGTGSVSVFDIDTLTGNFVQVQKLRSPQGIENGQFGYTLEADGNRLIVGARSESRVYVYEKTGAVWSLVQTLDELHLTLPAGSNFWYGISLDVENDMLAIGYANDNEDYTGITNDVAGSVYLYKRTGTGTWVLEQKLLNTHNRGDGDRFGWSTLICDSLIVAGSYWHAATDSAGNTVHSGAAYTFEYCPSYAVHHTSASTCPGTTLAFGSLVLDSTGTYAQTFTGAAGCDSVVVMDFEMTGYGYLDITFAVLSYIGESDSIQWIDCNNGGAPLPGVNFESIYSPDTAVTTAAVIYLNGCSDTTACYRISPIGINEYGALAGVSVYPNPVGSTFSLKSTVPLAALSIKDHTGRTLSAGIGSPQNICTDNLSPGIYFICFEANGVQKALPFVKP